MFGLALAQDFAEIVNDYIRSSVGRARAGRVVELVDIDRLLRGHAQESGGPGRTNLNSFSFLPMVGARKWADGVRRSIIVLSTTENSVNDRTPSGTASFDAGFLLPAQPY